MHLQHARQLRVAVRHVAALAALIAQGTDHVAQDQQPVVDVYALLQPVASGL
jgi:hypothetical protein